LVAFKNKLVQCGHKVADCINLEHPVVIYKM
jgi:hypothetical protein